MLKDAKEYVTGCEECQRNKIRRVAKHAPLNPNPIPEYPWEEISANLIGLLPKSEGCDAIAVIVDRFSKMVKLIPTTTNLTSKGLAEIYRDYIWREHGLPRKIISD